MKKVLLAMMCVLSLSLVVVADNPNQDKELALIRQVLQLTRGGWVAEKTPVSALSNAERKKLCGLYPVARYQELHPATNELLGTPRGSGYVTMTSVKNQGQCGSCWAFAATACVEVVNGGGSLDLSEQNLVDCCTVCSGCNGGYIGSTFGWIKSNGMTTEAAYPYTAQDGTCQSSHGSYTISGYSNVYSDTAIKSAIDAGHPVDTGMYVYTDFMYYSSGIYTHSWGNMEGGHAVVICGYDDAQGCWTIKNSWGTGWGENGYFRIAYGECNIPWMAAYAY